MASSRGPPWLPASVAGARKFAYWGQPVFFVFFFIMLVFGVINVLLGAFTWGVYLLISAAVNLVVVMLLKITVFDILDQGKFKEASDRLLIWGILGIVFGVLPGIFLIVAFVKIQEIFQPQYQPYPPQEEGGPQQQQYRQPPQYGPQRGRPQEPERSETKEEKEPAASRNTKPEMVKCGGCGVRYPSFMRTCPNCGEARD